MKYVICIFLLMSVTLQGAKILTDNGSYPPREFIAIVYEDSELKPIYVRAERIPSGKDVSRAYLGVYLRVAIDYETSIPTILLGDNQEFEGHLTAVVNMHGIDSDGFEWIYAEEWLNTRWLGWVYAAHYPFLFVADKGWCYVVENEEAVYDIYSYDSDSWSHMDLVKTWSNPVWEYDQP